GEPEGVGLEQANEVVAVGGRLGVEVMSRIAGSQLSELVVPAGLHRDRSPVAARADVEAGDRGGAGALASRLVDRPHLDRRAREPGVLRKVDISTRESDAPI